nr:helix-turn-helix transcriptional regulator [uncultured Blautia sp.]
MTQGERVREIRKALGLTLDKFGDKIGLKKSGLSLIENGRNDLTEVNTKSICREFNVNESWLRDGSGEMFVSSTPYEKAYNRFGYIMENASPSKRAVLTTLLELVYAVPDDVWANIMKQYELAMKDIKKEED